MLLERVVAAKKEDRDRVKALPAVGDCQGGDVDWQWAKPCILRTAWIVGCRLDRS